MKKNTTRTVVLTAMLVALQVVFSKFLMIQVTPSIRFSIDSVPIQLAGLWLGPVAGAAVGFVADMAGTILFPTAGAWYPPLTLGFVMIGLVAGLFRGFVLKKPSLWRAALAVALAEAVGSLFFKTQALAWLRGIPFSVQFAARLLPVIINTVLDALIVFALNRLLYARMFGARAQKPPADRTGMTYDEALSFIHSVQWRGSRLGLARTRELLQKVGNPERRLKFVHVAGTNGKGSTAAMLASVLTAAGYRTGLYISPFINRFNERMQVDGAPIDDLLLAEITSYVRPFAEGMSDHPTEFELITAIGLLYFERMQCDIVVLEVGLGGELDSTNVIPVPEVAVITSIGLDHTRELGPTMADIAGAKAGIIKQGGDVVIYGDNAEADAVFAAVCRERGARLTVTDFSRITNQTASIDRLSFDFLPVTGLSIGLTGAYQYHNAAVALTAIEVLRQKGYTITDGTIRTGLANVRWPARFEVLRRSPLFIADGGHNPQGVAAAVESLTLHFPDRKIVFLLGIMADKDIPAMLPLICSVARSFVTVTPSNPRALPAPELADRLRALGFEATPTNSVREGVERAIALAGPDGIVCALGSLYMLGDVRACLLPDTVAQH